MDITLQYQLYPCSRSICTQTIPFSRDPVFVNRGDRLDQINRHCGTWRSRVCLEIANISKYLTGRQADSKSQLDIEFVHRPATRSTETRAVWVHANTQARFLQDYTLIADKVKLSLPQLVFDWLSNPRNTKWLLFLDSADDPDVFFHKTSGDETRRNLAEYLPQSPNGSIVITTRNKNLAYRLIGSAQRIHQVGPMTQGLMLLENRLGSLPDESVAPDLVRVLGRVPLAISQAAAYILRRSPRTSLSQYLTEVEQSEKKRVKLLGHDAGDPRRDLLQDRAASNAMLTTWQVSFDHIRSSISTCLVLAWTGGSSTTQSLLGCGGKSWLSFGSVASAYLPTDS